MLFGVLGCGPTVERFHVPALVRAGHTALTGVFDPIPERARLVARAAPGSRAFPSAEALLEARVVDAVIIALPVEARAGLAVKALGAGLPVLIEPPMATSVEEAERIRQAERQARLPVVVGFHRRFWEPVLRARRALEAGPQDEMALGVETLFAGAGQAGDPLDALGIHLDLVRYLLDRDIARVSARRDTSHDVEARVTLHGSGTAGIRVIGAGRLEEEVRIRAGRRRFLIRAGSERIRPAGGLGRGILDLIGLARLRTFGGRDSLTRSYQLQLEAFLARIASRGGAGTGTSDDGLAALLATETVRRSLYEGGGELAVPPTTPA